MRAAGKHRGFEVIGLASFAGGAGKFDPALDYFGHLGGGTLIEVTQELGIAHEAEMLVAYPRDHAVGGEFAQPIEWEDAVDVGRSRSETGRRGHPSREG